MKQYQFAFSSHGDRDFAKLPRDEQQRITMKLAAYEKLKNPLEKAVKLHGFQNKYRFRVGDYRIICTKIPDGSIIILLIHQVGHRSSIYNDL